jgi:microsomal dipeptidase-like Zn-dependent dipeptidase
LFVVSIVTTILGVSTGKSTRCVRASPILAAILGGLLFTALPPFTDSVMNRVANVSAAEAAAAALTPAEVAWHNSLPFVADLHADTLLWTHRRFVPLPGEPDAAARGAPLGLLDGPKISRGNIGLQMLTLVTGIPLFMKWAQNEEPSVVTDLAGVLAFTNRWPASTWASRKGRALHQIAVLERELGEYEAVRGESDPEFILVKDGPSLERVVTARAAGERRVHALLLGVEGGHAVGPTLDGVDELYAAGVRSLGTTHFFDNLLGGSAHGVSLSGLSPFGRAALRRAASLGMVLDIAHASPATIADMIHLARELNATLISSHTGSQSVCGHWRNIDDVTARAIAETGGVIGVGFFSPTVCGADLIASIVETIVHFVKVVGEEGVGLGSDWDGAARCAFAADDLAVLSAALRRDGRLTDDQVRTVMGQSTINMWRRVLK